MLHREPGTRSPLIPPGYSRIESVQIEVNVHCLHAAAESAQGRAEQWPHSTFPDLMGWNLLHARLVENFLLFGIDVPHAGEDHVFRWQASEPGDRFAEAPPAVASRDCEAHAIKETTDRSIRRVELTVRIEPEHAGLRRVQTGDGS